MSVGYYCSSYHISSRDLTLNSSMIKWKYTWSRLHLFTQSRGWTKPTWRLSCTLGIYMSPICRFILSDPTSDKAIIWLQSIRYTYLGDKPNPCVTARDLGRYTTCPLVLKPSCKWRRSDFQSRPRCVSLRPFPCEKCSLTSGSWELLCWNRSVHWTLLPYSYSLYSMVVKRIFFLFLQCVHERCWKHIFI